MDEDVDALLEVAGNRQRGLENGVDVAQPAARVHAADEGVHGGRLELARVQQLRQTGAHHVDVLDAEELELDVLVEVLVLVALARRPVRHRIDLTTTVPHYKNWLNEFLKNNFSWAFFYFRYQVM